MSELPAVVDVAWLQGELGADDLFLGDVRGPNAHARGHIPGSRPLVLGSPPPMSDREMLEALAPEVGLRLRRHGVTGDERLVLYDRGDGMGAMPAAQMAELAGTSHYGEELRESAEEKAQRIVAEEMQRLGWKEDELRRHRKGHRLKVKIARRLRQETTMTLQWIADRLQMGTWTHVANRLYHRKN